MVRPLVRDSEEPIDLGLGDGNEKSQTTILGKRLSNMRGRIFGGYQLVAANKHQGAQLWRLENVENISEHERSAVA